MHTHTAFGVKLNLDVIAKKDMYGYQSSARSSQGEQSGG